jgi:hypothetical protein
MRKWILFLALFAIPTLAEAQKTCTKITNTSQNCAVTITITPGPVDADHKAATSFIIRRNESDGQMNVISTITATTMQNTFTDAGNVKHCYDAQGINADGGGFLSPQACWATPAIVQTPQPPNAPGAPTLSNVTRNSMQVSWKDNSDDEKGFAVTRIRDSNLEKIVLGAPNAPSIVDTGLQANTIYRYQVAAFNDAGFSVPSKSVLARTLR